MRGAGPGLQQRLRPAGGDSVSISVSACGKPGFSTAAQSMIHNDFSSLFERLPIGAYRSSPDGRQLRANPALVRLDGYATEAELLAATKDLAQEWYVDPARRDLFKHLLETHGQVLGLVSEQPNAGL